MSTNAAILTETARDATALDIDGYMNGVAAHVGGDWIAHGCVRVYSGSSGTYYDEGGGVVSQQSLRMVTTAGASDIAVVLPIISSGSTASPEGVAPFVVVQPQNITTTAGRTVQFSIVVISATAPTYTWIDLSGDPVTGGNASNLLFSPVTTDHAGTYQCRADNIYGSTYSNQVVLKVS